MAQGVHRGVHHRRHCERGALAVRGGRLESVAAARVDREKLRVRDQQRAVGLGLGGERQTQGLSVYDAGVAGLHRLVAELETLRKAKVVVTVAGMEGALPSVVAGLVKAPVIAVPTSVGYGASFGGVAALLAMLNSCASGLSVVNIDNGFGAGYLANMINKL